jgi:uncharacterized membrane protein YiaA
MSRLIASRRAACAVLAGIGVLLAVFLWLNLRVPAAGIVQDALLDSQNPYYLAQQEVGARKALRQGDPMSFVLSFPQGMEERDMLQVLRMTDDLRRRFPQAVVWSLAADSYAYSASTQELESRPHIDRSWVGSDGRLTLPMPIAEWREAVAADPGASGLLVGKNFRYAQILLFMPEGPNELDLVQQVAEYLEQRPIHRLEWLLLKGDIKPAAEFHNVSLGGWSVGRGLMHFALMSDVLFYSTIGLVVATLAALLALKSFKQALYSSSCILASFIFVRGVIALAELLGVQVLGAPLAERVYFLLVLSAMIVAGISFNTRARERYNGLRRASPHTDSAALWALVERHHLPMNVVTVIAILNFATLPQIGIRGIMEVGVLSAIGIAFQRVLVSTMLPALQIAFGGAPVERSGELGALQRLWERGVQAFPRWSFMLITRLGQRAPYVSLLVCLVTVSAAAVVVVHDLTAANKWIVVQEKPIDYLPDTIVDRGRHLLNREGNVGFGRLSYFVEPRRANGKSVEDPLFLQRAAAFQQSVAALAEARGANSVLDTIGYIGRQEHGPSMPSTSQQAHDRLRQISWDLEQQQLAQYLWTDAGLAIYVSHPADNSTSLRAFARQIEQLAQREFPDLRVLPFGPLHAYHQTDLYISEGKPLNVLLSFPLVVLCCSFWLGMRARRDGGTEPATVLRPWVTACAITVPFLFSYAAIVVLMAAFTIPLDQATACATALGINAAVDFGLYLINDYREALEEGSTPHQALQCALAERGHITLTDAALNAICFSFLMLSPFLPIQRLGVVMLVMLATCAIGALLLMPAMLSLCGRQPGQRAAQQINLYPEQIK